MCDCLTLYMLLLPPYGSPNLSRTIHRTYTYDKDLYFCRKCWMIENLDGVSERTRKRGHRKVDGGRNHEGTKQQRLGTGQKREHEKMYF